MTFFYILSETPLFCSGKANDPYKALTHRDAFRFYGISGKGSGQTGTPFRGIVLAVLMVFVFSFAQGSTKTWVPTSGGAWTTPGNWNPSGAPVAGDDVVIPANQSANITAVPSISLKSLTINGNCTFQGTSDPNTITITGSITVASGKTFNLGVNAQNQHMVFTLNSGAIGLIEGTVIWPYYGGVTMANTINGTLTYSSYSSGGALTLTIPSGGTLIMGPNGVVNSSGSSNANFNLSSGATLKIGSAYGILTGTSTGATAGNIQVTGTRTYSSGANYEYNGTSAQNTGDGYPSALIGSLTINNASGVTMVSATRTITTGTLNLTIGAFTTNPAGTNRLSLGSTATVNRSEGSFSGTPQGTGIYNIIYTGNSKTTGPEAAGSGLSNVTVALAAGQTLTLDQNRSPDGNLTVSSGIFDLGTYTINRSSAGGGTLTVNNGAFLKIGGTNALPNLYSTLSFNSSSTIEYYGTDQSIGLPASQVTYGNLVLSGSGTKTAGREFTVLGTTTLSGITLATASYILTLGQIAMTDNSAISLGSLVQLMFSSSSSKTWTGTLTINNWTGTPGSSATGSYVLVLGSPGLSAAQLSQVTFDGFAPGAKLLGGELIPLQAILAITGTTAHGSACVGSAAPSITYTITNTGSNASDIAVTSDNSGFVVSDLSSATIDGYGGTATYKVTFTPASSGSKSATVSVTSTSPGSNAPTSSLTGNGNSVPTFTVDKTNITCNGANNGSITVNATGGTSPYEYSLTGDTYTGNYETGNVFLGLKPNVSYTVKVKDKNLCEQINCTINP